MKRLIMPLLAALMCFAFWPAFANATPDYAIYATSLDINRAVTDTVAPVPPANHDTRNALTEDNSSTDTHLVLAAAVGADPDPTPAVHSIRCHEDIVTTEPMFAERWHENKPRCT